MDISQIRDDLIAEQNSLDAIVAGLDDDQWKTPTPSPRWSVADQIAHLTYFDHSATVAIRDPEGFKALANELLSIAPGGDEAVDDLTLGPYRQMTPAELLEAWRETRGQLARAAASLDNDTRVIWYGPEMSSKSFITARLMETWAHGQDVVDAVGVSRAPTARLRHIAQLGFITRNWSYINRGENPPAEPVRVTLTGPEDDTWNFGPADAAEAATGPALDFCLVVTQRRHVDDTDLVATPLAREWLLKAQAFAGAPTDGPAPGRRV